MPFIGPVGRDRGRPVSLWPAHKGLCPLPAHQDGLGPGQGSAGYWPVPGHLFLPKRPCDIGPPLVPSPNTDEETGPERS